MLSVVSDRKTPPNARRRPGSSTAGTWSAPRSACSSCRRVWSAGLRRLRRGAAEEHGWSKTALSGAAALQQMESGAARAGAGLAARPLRPAGVHARRRRRLRRRPDAAQPGRVAGRLLRRLHRHRARHAACAASSRSTSSLIHWFERKRARALSAMSLGLAARRHAGAAGRLSLQTFGWRADRVRLRHHRHRVGLPLAFGDPQQPAGPWRDGRRHAAEELRAEPKRSVHRRQRHARLHRPRGAAHAGVLAASRSATASRCSSCTAVLVHAITHLKEGLGYSIAHGLAGDQR